MPGELGERIAAARREAGLTQGACAARADIERTALAKIETGARRVGAVELARLADALDVRIEWFFEDAPPSVVSRRNAAEAGAPSPVIDRSVERLAREIEFLQRIGPDLNLPASPELPAPGGVDEAEAAAREARRMLGYDKGEPAVGLADRAADLGLLVFSLELGDDAADGASILLSRGGVAVVTPCTPRCRWHRSDLLQRAVPLPLLLAPERHHRRRPPLHRIPGWHPGCHREQLGRPPAALPRRQRPQVPGKWAAERGRPPTNWSSARQRGASLRLSRSTTARRLLNNAVSRQHASL